MLLNTLNVMPGRKPLTACFAALLILTYSLIFSTAKAESYPENSISMVVGFGVGGSADRMARAMSPYMEHELGNTIDVINKKGASTQIAANYVLQQPGDGYTIFASAFTPYLANSILNGKASYAINDFTYINFQWFDFDLIAVNKDSDYKTIEQLITRIRNEPKAVKASVVQGSAGHLMLRLLLEANNIPQENLDLLSFNGGGKARAAIVSGKVDFGAISAQGSEGIRKFLRPLAVVNDTRSDKWDAPTINQALIPLNVTVPILPGSIRGFAVSSEFKQKFPERFETLNMAIQNTLTRKDVQKFLKKSDIGGVWIGHEKSTELMQQNFEIFKKYAYLLKDQ
ncbi:MAG: Bug family tripartite tricarboxylate transporter substrate binding protein [Arenicella sp.]